MNSPPTPAATELAPAMRLREGLLLVDKPAGCTSHDVVARARRALGVKRIGHAGTLDPFATGLLILLVGRATRLATWLDGEPKVYDATIAFGTETDSDDATGAVTAVAQPPARDRIEAALPMLTGALDQLPPAVSAKQVGGVRAHAAARRGAPLALTPARVTVHDWAVREMDAGRLAARITCSGGTYIRALARDLGRLAGSAAHLASLRRVRSGPFHVEDAVALDDIGAGTPLRSPLDGLRTLVMERLDDEAVAGLRHGRAVGATQPGTRAALVDERGVLVAVAEREADRWQPRVVLVDD